MQTARQKNMLCPLKASCSLERPVMCLSKEKPWLGWVTNAGYTQRQEKNSYIWSEDNYVLDKVVRSLDSWDTLACLIWRSSFSSLYPQYRSVLTCLQLLDWRNLQKQKLEARGRTKRERPHAPTMQMVLLRKNVHDGYQPLSAKLCDLISLLEQPMG